MAKSVQELERIVMQLNKDLIAWQKWAQEFRNWTVNELNRMKAGRPNGPNPIEPVTVTSSPQPDIRDLQMAAMMRTMKSMATDLDIIAADAMFGK